MALVAAVAIAGPATAADAPQPTHTVVPVKNRKIYTDTGIKLTKGETVSVRASGKMDFGGGAVAAAASTPDGVPWGPACTKIANSEGHRARWPAPELNCWSLIGRVGTSKPFQVGTEATFKVGNDGTLYLGLNDNFVKDNHGRWTAAVTVTAAVPAKSHTTTYILIALLLIALVLLFLLWRWYRKRPKREKAGEPAAAAAIVPAHLANVPPASDQPIEEPAAEPAEVAPEAAVATMVAQPFAGPQADSIDVNIFEVEFSNGLTMRVGYNHFPEGTNVRWRVTQQRVPVAVGEFVTKGGGSIDHFETVPLGVKLEGRAAMPDGADVQFDWSINGVPFKYSVRRDPNC